jgi:Zn-dependent M28 family amino/carboxypeptidase
MKLFGFGHGFVVAALLTSSALPAFAADSADPYQDVLQAISQPHLQQLMKDMTGENPVKVGGQSLTLRDRYLPNSKANWRSYWKAYYESLGMSVTEQSFEVDSSIETQGHNLEAVLPGASADSVVIIVHYDSMGPHGSDNEAVDDDMTGMSVQMETARILASMKGRLQYTVRFVAADYEEWGQLAGARYYAKTLKALSASQGFKIVSAVDDEQSGWKETAGTDTLDLFDCSPTRRYNSKSLGAMFTDTASKYGTLKVKTACMGENSDHYAMWEIGVPTVVFSEHDPFNNPHFDHDGGDTYLRIDQAYFFQIAQVGITFAARMVGIH